MPGSPHPPTGATSDDLSGDDTIPSPATIRRGASNQADRVSTAIEERSARPAAVDDVGHPAPPSTASPPSPTNGDDALPPPSGPPNDSQAAGSSPEGTPPSASRAADSSGDRDRSPLGTLSSLVSRISRNIFGMIPLPVFRQNSANSDRQTNGTAGTTNPSQSTPSVNGQGTPTSSDARSNSPSQAPFQLPQPVVGIPLLSPFITFGRSDSSGNAGGNAAATAVAAATAAGFFGPAPPPTEPPAPPPTQSFTISYIIPMSPAQDPEQISAALSSATERIFARMMAGNGRTGEQNLGGDGSAPEQDAAQGPFGRVTQTPEAMEPAAAAGGFFAPPQPSAPAAQAGGPETASELLERMLMRGTGVGGVGTIRIPFGATGIHFIPAENEDDSENTPTDAASDGDARRPRSSRPRIRVLRPDRRPEIFDSLSGALAHAFRDLVRSIGQNIHLQGQPPASEAAVAALEVVTFPVEVAKGCKMLSPLCVVCQEEFEVVEVEEGGSRREGSSSGAETQAGREAAVAVTAAATQEESNAQTDGPDQPPAENAERPEAGLKMPCGHVFHAECLKPWLKNSNTCPTCRFEIMTDNEDYNAGAKQRMEARAAAAAAASAEDTATTSGDGDVGMDEADEAGPSESRKRRREDAEVEDDQGEGEGSAERAAPRVRSS